MGRSATVALQNYVSFHADHYMRSVLITNKFKCSKGGIFKHYRLSSNEEIDLVTMNDLNDLVGKMEEVCSDQAYPKIHERNCRLLNNYIHVYITVSRMEN